MTRRVSVSAALILGALLGALQCSPPRETSPANTEATPSSQSDLSGTSWQLVKFEGGDETVLTPDAGTPSPSSPVAG